MGLKIVIYHFTIVWVAHLHAHGLDRRTGLRGSSTREVGGQESRRPSESSEGVASSPLASPRRGWDVCFPLPAAFTEGDGSSVPPTLFFVQEMKFARPRLQGDIICAPPG